MSLWLYLGAGSTSGGGGTVSKRNEWAAKRGAYSFMQMSLSKMNVASTRYGGRYGKGKLFAPFITITAIKCIYLSYGIIGNIINSANCIFSVYILKRT